MINQDQINPVNLSRAEQDYQTALKSGFSPKQPLYRLGTPVNEWGRNNLKLSRQRWEENPLTQDDCDKHIELIRKEEREDHKYNLKDFYMTIAGQLDGPEILVPTQWSLRQMLLRSRVVTNELTSEAVLDAADYVSNLRSPLKLRKDICNYYFGNSKRDGWFRTRKNPAGQERELYSVVSDRYNRSCTTDNLLTIIRDKLDENRNIPSRSETTYDGDRLQMDIVYHTFIKPEDCVAGEIFQSGIRITTNDNGSERIRISPFVLRNLCLNLIVIDRAEQNIEISHLKSSLEDTVKEAIDSAISKISDFAENWSLACRESILDGIYTNADPKIIIEKLVKEGYGRIPGLSKTEVTQKIYNAWLKEPDEQKWSRASFVNALTLAAHTESWSNTWISSQLEENAGNLLYNKLIINYGEEKSDPA
jgi:hypothetical protein